MEGSFYTGKYRNFFEEQGYDRQEIDSRLEKIFQTLLLIQSNIKLPH